MMKRILWSGLALVLAGIVLFGCASSATTGNTGVTGTGGTTTTGGTTGTGTAAPTGTGTGSPSIPGTVQQPVPAENEGSASDFAVTNAVRNKLNAEGITPAMEIQVHVKDGQVTLTGTVADQATADRIVQLVRGVDNVKDVDSQLEVAQ